MISSPNSFTEEYLSGLKFKELQKLSVHFCVNKRWAKKQELIENLLALKNKENSSTDNQEQEEEWRDGSIAFNNTRKSSKGEESRRLTFNVNTKSNSRDSRLTFDVSQNDKQLSGKTFNSRETYDVPSTQMVLEISPRFLAEARATFDIPPKKKLVDEIDSRATFDVPQNGLKLIEENVINNNTNKEPKKLKNAKKNSKGNKEEIDDSGSKTDLRKIKLDMNIKSNKLHKDGTGREQVKTLTIPCARVTRTKRNGGTTSSDISPIKMSKKSINIKKSSSRLPVTKNTLIKSPAFSSVKNSVNKQTIIQSITKNQPVKTVKSRLPIRLEFNEQKPLESPLESNKENTRKILKKRLSKTADEALLTKPNSVKVNFRTPPSSASKNWKTLPLKKTPVRKETQGTSLGNKSTSKQITAKRMPDFSKIHQKQFEQMDSLHDYLRKKEERIRKLFGTPQPGQQLQVVQKSAPVFRFQSKAEKEKGTETLKGLTTPLKQKENISKMAQKDAFKSKLPPSKLRTDIKDKNRSHIHGVRTNKRFELQMKFRNI